MATITIKSEYKELAKSITGDSRVEISYHDIETKELTKEFIKEKGLLINDINKELMGEVLTYSYLKTQEKARK